MIRTSAGTSSARCCLMSFTSGLLQGEKREQRSVPAYTKIMVEAHFADDIKRLPLQT